jgi:VanZ family protein
LGCIRTGLFGFQLRRFDLDVTFIRLVARLAGWLLLVVIVFLNLSPPSYRPVTSAGHNLEHFLIYLALGVTFGVGYVRRWWLLALGLVGLTAAVEFGQLFVPGRHARLRDFLIDAGAACLGIALAWIGGVVTSTLSRSPRSGSSCVERPD